MRWKQNRGGCKLPWGKERGGWKMVLEKGGGGVAYEKGISTNLAFKNRKNTKMFRR